MRGGLDDAQVGEAYRLFYGEGLTLGEVAEKLGCGVYQLSPWLGAPAMAIAAQATSDERSRAKPLRRAARAFVEAYQARYGYAPDSPRCGFRRNAPLRDEAVALAGTVEADRVWDR